MAKTPSRWLDLAAAIEAVPSPMALLAPDLTYLALSPLWAELHGVDTALLRGRSYEALFPEAAAGWADARASALDGQTSAARPVALVDADGRTVWIRYSARPWVPGSGDVVEGLVVHAADATEEVRAATHANRQRSLVDAVTQHAPLVVFGFDRTGRVTMRAGKGLEAAALFAGVWGGADLLAEPAAVAEGVQSVLAGEPAAWTTRWQGRTYEVSAAPTFCADGTVDGGVGVGVDVTERVDAERRATRQAEGLRRVVSVISRPGRLDALAAALLAELTGFLGLRSGLLARVGDGTYTCLASYARTGDAMAPGTTMPLGDTYCDLTMEAHAVVAIDHMGTSEHVGHRCYAALGLEAYIGAPVVVGGELFGALSFSSPTPAERPFTQADRDLVRVAAEWAGGLVEREELRLQQAPPEVASARLEP